METTSKVASRLGCLISILGPLVALVVYPRASWLFWSALIGVAVILLNGVLAKNPTPQRLADEIERLLAGNSSGWDIDDFEHRRIRDPQLRELWHRSMKIGGPPENWPQLDKAQKEQLRELIRQLRELGKARG